MRNAQIGQNFVDRLSKIKIESLVVSVLRISLKSGKKNASQGTKLALREVMILQHNLLTEFVV